MWIRIKFICSKCGQESWAEIDNDSYILTTADLLCDDCIPIEGEGSE